MEFSVEGRYFPNSLWAFTFALIQADRMHRTVEVHTNVPGASKQGRHFKSITWHATAQPSNSVRRHLVRETK